MRSRQEYTRFWILGLLTALCVFTVGGLILQLAGCTAEQVAATQGTLAGAREEVAASGESTERVETVEKVVTASTKADGTIDTTSALLGGGSMLALWALREGLRLRKSKEADSALRKKETSGSGTFGQRPT